MAFRLLFVQRYYWPAVQYGGPVFATHHLLKTLVRKGMDVTVYTTNLGLEGKVAESRAVEVDGVGVFYFPYLRMLDFLGSSG